jgi:hypothetical protein
MDDAGLVCLAVVVDLLVDWSPPNSWLLLYLSKVLSSHEGAVAEWFKALLLNDRKLMQTIRSQVRTPARTPLHKKMFYNLLEYLVILIGCKVG